MATSNIWEVTLRSSLQGQECANIFYFRGNALTNPDASDIAQAFEEQYLPDIQDCVANDVSFNSIDVRDILSTVAPFILGISEIGAAGSGDSLPAHDAIGLLLNVATTLTRPGHKRLPGILEANVSDGVIGDSGLISALNALATTMVLNLFDTSTGLIPWAAHVVVKRILDDGHYRLPTSTGEAVTNLIETVIPSLLVTSQVSRKQGTS